VVFGQKHREATMFSFFGNHSLAGKLCRALFVACVLTATYPLASAFGQALPPYDFSFGAAGGQHVVVGHNLYIKLQIALTTGAAKNLFFQVNGLPAGVSYSFPDLEATCCGTGVGAYEWGPGSTTLLLRTSPSTPPGSYTLQVTATSGGVSRSISYPFVVDSVPAVPTAAPITAQMPIPSLAQWQSNMTRYGTTHCQTIQADPAGQLAATYYDAQRVYLQIGDYTRNGTWKACAQAARTSYRDDYVIPNNGGMPGYWNFTHGLMMDYLRSGDVQSKNAALLLSNNAAFASDSTPFSSVIGAALSREVAYAINSYLNAEKVGAPARARLDQYVDVALGHIDQLFVSKSYRAPAGQCDVAGAPNGAYCPKPFMVGLIAEALIGYYEKTNDPRIFLAVKTAMDWLWANAWVPANQSFWYGNFVSDPSQPFPAQPGTPDLNLLIAPAYAWLYQMTGDTRYRDQGDQIFAGGVAGAYLGGSKQFNQNYKWTFDYVNWRTTVTPGTVDPPSPPPPPPSDTTPPAISITAPVNGATVPSAITVSASASDNVGVAGVQFKLDGVNTGAEDSIAPYNYLLNTMSLANGAHTIVAVARDAAGNTATAPAVTVTVNNTTPPLPVSTAPVAWFMFNELSGTTATDSSGSGNTLALSGGASFVPGKFGNALSFNGVDGAARAASTTGLNGSQALTIAAFINPAALAQGFWAFNTVAIKGDLAAGRGYGMNIRNGVLNFAKSAGDVTSAVALSSGVFQHVAITWDPATQEVKFYRDGSLIQTILDASAIPAALDSDPLTVGAWPTGGSYFNGVIDDLRIYNRALSASEVSSLANASGDPQPMVSMTTPAAGSTVAGTVTVSATAIDNADVVGVQFKLDGATLGAELTAAPYTISWNTTTASNGAHALTAVARDAAGNISISSVVSVTVANPTVSILAPQNGANLTNQTKVKVQASSSIGLSAIQIYSDSSLIGTVSCANNSCSDLVSTVRWLTSDLAAGPHSLYAVATDMFGNSSSSTPITVNK
jgi:hypothetical protein